MSVTGTRRRVTPADIRARKGGQPVVCLTAYTTPVARIADPHCDLLLVGDSVGMVLHGLPSTLGVTVEMMILHAQAVARGSERALIVVDLPFGSYEDSPQQAFATAARIMRDTGCGAVKLEGGRHMAPTIRFLVDRGVPVMGHVGLTPQAVNVLGGYGARGRSQREHETIIADGEAVEPDGIRAAGQDLEGLGADRAGGAQHDGPAGGRGGSR